ncbi:hypothetical protein HJFPF1_06433 [Paramyrothecium foliicola]|nr:hypothetical protein HJFPF1_06433 [Paramyrothecium foliicola]
MPRSRRSGYQQPEEFTIRWHSVVNMATPSADIMSSPDPLMESPAAQSVVPSSRRSSRVTRSARSSRFLSTTEKSPRKQMFELEVGDGKAPQKLLVTVETESGSSAKSARRKLFQQSSPASVRRRGDYATTTTVPLRDSIEDEIATETTTPRRRGRPRKSNGTPMPGAGTKRKASTPAKRTPRQPRAPTAEDVEDALQSDVVAQPTPTPKRRGRPPRSRASTAEPRSEPASDFTQTGTGTRRVGRRRQALIPDEVEELVDEVANNATIEEDSNDLPPSDNDIDLIAAPDEVDLIMAVDDEPMPYDAPPEEESTAMGPRDADLNIVDGNDAGADDESDIWMATLSDEATPRAPNQTARETLSPPPSVGRRSPQLADNDQAEPNDYGYLAPAASDTSSVDDHIPRTNDTIAQGEDFSMIFMDSIPSLQASLRADTNPMASNEEIGEETNLIINNTLASLRESMRQEFTQEVEITREVELEAEADFQAEELDPEPEPQPELVAMEFDDPPDLPQSQAPTEQTVEKAKTPPRSENHLSPGRSLSARWSRSPRKINDSPLRRQALRFTARQAEGHATAQNKEAEQENEGHENDARPELTQHSTAEQSNLYEDSFSEIPQEVLAAATPRRPTTQPMDTVVDAGHSTSWVEERQEEALQEVEPTEQHLSNVEGEEATAASNMSIASRSDNTRLPTPDDTPPYNEVEVLPDLEKSRQTTEPSPHPSNPEVVEDLPPPRSDSSPAIDQESQLRINVSVPSVVTKMTPVNQMSSPVQEPQSIGADNIHEKLLRPVLSPIVRAGRALQSVTSDPPSPDRVERQLGSPFRSSVSKESWSGSKESQNGRRMSAGSPRQASLPRDQPMVTGRPSEDPFAASTRSNGQPSFMQALARSMMSTASKGQSPVRVSANSSVQNSHIGDEMSWVADEGPLSPRLRGDNTLKDTIPPAPATSAPAIQSFPLGQIDGAADDIVEVQGGEDVENDEDRDMPQEADDETDIWEFEARRETPATSRQQPFGKRVATSVNRRRGLPSPWKKPASQVTQEQSAPAASPEKRPSQRANSRFVAQEADETVEYSLLAQQNKEQEAAPESAAKPKPFDLASFFSSPAALPGMLAKKFLPSKAADELGSAAAQHNPSPGPQPRAMPTSSMFPQASQRQPQTIPQPSLSTSVHSQHLDVEEEEEEEEEEVEEQHSSSSSSEQPELPTISQKQNFTPKPKQPSQSFFQPSSARSAATTPPRMQLSHADIQRWQQETSNASETSPHFRRPLLRPLPPKNASPTKSSLRSPLKPHTPGRVVEFTSSVLSPVEQARVRKQRRQSNSTTASQPDFATQAPTVAGLPASGNEENHDAHDVSMTDTSSAAKSARSSSHPQELLSQTVWTRQHWLLLDALLQIRRQGPFDVVLEGGAEKFLGKSVKSHGKAMRLEQWHLDCVDAFKAEVGGWDEAVLVKRLFALLLGEERRRRDAVEKQRTVMFH